MPISRVNTTASEHGADAKTTVVPPPAEKPALAWSEDWDREFDAAPNERRWHSAVGKSAPFLAIVALVGFVAMCALAAVLATSPNRAAQSTFTPPAVPTDNAPSPMAVLEGSLPPTSSPAPKDPATPAPPVPVAAPKPPASDPGDYTWVAMAVSPTAISNHLGDHAANVGGYGRGASRVMAVDAALQQCAEGTGNSDCRLVNNGVNNGCVAYMVDEANGAFAGGTGTNENAAIVKASLILGASSPPWGDAVCSTSVPNAN